LIYALKKFLIDISYTMLNLKKIRGLGTRISIYVKI
jgi:hypothetical protein